MLSSSTSSLAGSVLFVGVGAVLLGVGLGVLVGVGDGEVVGVGDGAVLVGVGLAVTVGVGLAVTDDVGVGARPGHHAGSGRSDALHARVDANEFAGDDGGCHDYVAPVPSAFAVV